MIHNQIKLFKWFVLPRILNSLNQFKWLSNRTFVLNWTLFREHWALQHLTFACGPFYSLISNCCASFVFNFTVPFYKIFSYLFLCSNFVFIVHAICGPLGWLNFSFSSSYILTIDNMNIIFSIFFYLCPFLFLCSFQFHSIQSTQIFFHIIALLDINIVLICIEHDLLFLSMLNLNICNILVNAMNMNNLTFERNFKDSELVQYVW